MQVLISHTQLQVLVNELYLDPAKIVLFKQGSLSVAAILFSSHSYNLNNFAWAVIMLFRISGALQAYFGSLKGCYQHRYYCRECLYSQISVRQRRKLTFSLRLPLRRHIAQLGMFSVDAGIVVSFYASAHHPYTTPAVDE